MTDPDGLPSAAFRDDPWVVAVERAEAARAAAVNTADFTGAELLALWGVDWAYNMSGETERGLLYGTASVWTGPWQLEVLAVDVGPDGDSADVHGCVHAPEEIPERTSPNAEGTVPFVYRLELQPDGSRRIVGAGKPAEPFVLPDGRQVDEELCEQVELKRGVFSPEPDLAALEAKDVEDVLLPERMP